MGNAATSMPAEMFRALPCAICQTEAPYEVLFPERMPSGGITTQTFSARRMPDRVHYRIVQCRACRLVYSTPVLAEHLTADLYRDSHFTYGEIVEDLRKTYGTYLRRAATHVPAKQAFLEVGCGNGFVLSEALALGFRDVRGIEPSVEAVASAEPSVRASIVNGVLTAQTFPEHSFDLVAFFQTLDHLDEPNAFLQTIYRLLKPGGVVLALNHDVGAWSAHLLKERSPIFDIEHPYLYDQSTIRALCERNGFATLDVGSVWNTYTLKYWFTIAPLPARLRRWLLQGLALTPLLRWRFSVKAGNLYWIGRKPMADDRTRP